MLPSGCWWFRGGPSAPPGRFGDWGVHRVAVVKFADATHHDAGGPVSTAFRDAMIRAIGQEWVAPSELVIPANQPRPVGLIGIAQAQALGRLNRVNALLCGRILAYQWQPRPGRVWISVSLRMLECSHGTILWSHHATGVAPAPTEAEVPSAYDAAIKLAAKEFFDDLVGSPS